MQHAFIEIRHNPFGFFLSDAVKNFENKIPHGVDVRKISDLVWFQNFGHLDFAAGHKPGRKMIMLGMIDKTFRRQFMHFGDKFPHIAGPADFLAIRHAEAEVAETKIHLQEACQFEFQRFRILVDKGSADLIGFAADMRFARLNQDWQVMDFPFGHFYKIESRFFITLSLVRESQIGNNRQEVVLIGFKELFSFLIA